jgi:(p)ppGpp synthase/HD superfamily hydrolase
MTELYHRAYMLARSAHGGQVRRYTGEPYVTHPRDVADRVKVLTDDEDIIAAALLHDVLEDTDVKPDEIARVTNERVLRIVCELTDVFTSEAFPEMNREERKKKEAYRISGISWEAKLVKLADIMDNASTIELADPKFAKVWIKEKYRAIRAMLGGDL